MEGFMRHTITWHRVEAIPALALLSAGIWLWTGCSRPATPGPIAQHAEPGSRAIASSDHDLGRGQPVPIYTADRLDAARCQTSNCGGNSPIVNRFPINGLNPAGYANSQHVRLLPGRIASNKPGCNKATLNVNSRNELVGEGQGQCVHGDLAGATFEVSITEDGHTVTRSIQISAVATLHHLDAAFPAYMLTWRASAVSLCNRTEARAFELDTGLSNDLPFLDRRARKDDVRLTDVTVDERTPLRPDSIPAADLAIAFPGEVRGEDGSTIPGSMQAGWFNIACSRDALARADIYGIEKHLADPTSLPNYDDRRKAALKMLTANYCDVGRYTFEDNEIEWERKTPGGTWEFPGQHGSKPTGDFESVWDADGARCIVNSRLYNKTGIVVLPGNLYPPGCPGNVCETQEEFLTALVKVCRGVKRSCATEMNTGYFRSYSTGN
jgi:hypothetical protein